MAVELCFSRTDGYGLRPQKTSSLKSRHRCSKNAWRTEPKLSRKVFLVPVTAYPVFLEMDGLSPLDHPQGII